MAPRSEDLKLITCAINFELVQPICPARYINVTDGRTDGRTAYDSTRGRVRAEPSLQLGLQLTAGPRPYAAEENQRVGKTRRRSVYSADTRRGQTTGQPAKVTVPSCKLGNTALALVGASAQSPV